jgi:hypothetical protein
MMSQWSKCAGKPPPAGGGYTARWLINEPPTLAPALWPRSFMSLGLQASFHGGRWRRSLIEEEYRLRRAVDGITPPW